MYYMYSTVRVLNTAPNSFLIWHQNFLDSANEAYETKPYILPIWDPFANTQCSLFSSKFYAILNVQNKLRKSISKMAPKKIW